MEIRVSKKVKGLLFIVKSAFSLPASLLSNWEQLELTDVLSPIIGRNHSISR